MRDFFFFRETPVRKNALSGHSAVRRGRSIGEAMPESFAYEVREAQALATLRAFFKSSINFLDTAAPMATGKASAASASSSRIGGVQAGFVIASKADRDFKSGDFSGEQMKRSSNAACVCLASDFLPIMHLSRSGRTTFANVMSIGGPLEVLQRFEIKKVIG